jgi:glycosyltransferase involved in cell wall biosynthesis
MTRGRIVLKYYYLWHNTMHGVWRKIVRRAEALLIGPVDFVIAGNREVEAFCAGKVMIPHVRESIITAEFDRGKIQADGKVDGIRGIKIIFVGRLSPVKDPVTLINAFNVAKKTEPRLRLIICGDGELMEKCKKISGKDVHFLGFAGNVPSLLKACDIYVITSVYDASPRSLMEAMCMGLPTIATRVGGIPEYLPGDCGILVPPGKPEVLAEKMVELAADKGERRLFGENARRRILRYHDLSKNMDAEIEFVRRHLR